MNAKDIRKIAKRRLKQNYIKNVLVAFVVTFILTGGISYVSKNFLDVNITNEGAIKVLSFGRKRSNSDNLNEALDILIEHQEQQGEVFDKLNNGFNSTLLNIITSKQSMIFNIMRGTAESITGELSVAVIVTITSLLYLIVRHGFLAAFEVGRARSRPLLSRTKKIPQHAAFAHWPPIQGTQGNPCFTHPPREDNFALALDSHNRRLLHKIL